MKKGVFFLSSFFLAGLTVAPQANAQVNFQLIRPWDGCLDQGIATLRCVPIVLQNLVTFFTMFAGVLALFFILWAAIKYARSQGDPQEVESARKTLTFAIIGLVFVLFSFLILVFISQITGVEQISKPPEFPLE